jgi:ABC-type amino acid transport system permease subunit
MPQALPQAMPQALPQAMPRVMPWHISLDTSIVTVITFDEICFSMRNYFEDVEYRRDILFK